MSRELADLLPELREKILKLFDNCKLEGYDLRPFFTLRDPMTQAKLWRQSRTTQEIKEEVNRLKRSGAPFLAKLIIDVGPQAGKWATNAIPGMSWHQWGEAIDCYVIDVNSKAIWDTGHPGYLSYAQNAAKLGLTPGLYFKKKDGSPNPDAVHVQLRSKEVPDTYSLQEVDRIMKERFSAAA